MATLCPQVTDLGALYEPGKNRGPTYHKMAAEVVSAAAANPPVCLATYGHPWVYCYPTTLINQAAPLLGLRVEVFPGISAFDTLLVDLGTDIAANGIQMYEATDLLIRHRPIQNDVACVIWQPTVAGDPTCPSKPYPAEQFEPLQEYLLGFYSVDHEASLVTTKTHPLMRSVVKSLRFGRTGRDAGRRPRRRHPLHSPAASATDRRRSADGLHDHRGDRRAVEVMRSARFPRSAARTEGMRAGRHR